MFIFVADFLLLFYSMYIYEVLRFSLNLIRMFGSVLWLLCIEELGLWSSSMYIQLFIHTFPFTPCTLTHLESSAVSLRIGQPLGSKKWIKTFIIQKKKKYFLYYACSSWTTQLFADKGWAVGTPDCWASSLSSNLGV